jgi:geranylgeranylglycerol-phosphate geranylgeranyltransferase
VKKIKGFFTLLRFELPFSAGVCVVLGQLLSIGKLASPIITALGFLSVFFISASILVLNDFFDVETDKINAPHRPIPSNIVTKSEALMLTITLLFVGLILSYCINITALICTVLLLIVGILYNWKFKKSGLPGNLMVSFSVGMTFIYGGVSVGLPLNKAAWFFGIIAALVDLGEEIAADSMDMQGDLLINSNSLAIKHGKPAALKISSGIFLLVIVLTCVPFAVKWFSIIYFLPIGLMDIIIAYSAMKILKSKNDEGRKYIRWIYLGATLCLMIIILIRFIEGSDL